MFLVIADKDKHDGTERNRAKQSETERLPAAILYSFFPYGLAFGEWPLDLFKGQLRNTASSFYLFFSFSSPLAFFTAFPKSHTPPDGVFVSLTFQYIISQTSFCGFYHTFFLCLHLLPCFVSKQSKLGGGSRVKSSMSLQLKPIHHRGQQPYQPSFRVNHSFISLLPNCHLLNGKRGVSIDGSVRPLGLLLNDRRRRRNGGGGGGLGYRSIVASGIAGAPISDGSKPDKGFVSPPLSDILWPSAG